MPRDDVSHTFLVFMRAHEELLSGDAQFLLNAVGAWDLHDSTQTKWDDRAATLRAIKTYMPAADEARSALAKAGEDRLLQSFNAIISEIKMSNILENPSKTK